MIVRLRLFLVLLVLSIVGPAFAQNGPAAPAPSKSTALWAVRLDNGGPNKDRVIKVVRELAGLDLMSAKDLVDQAPKPVIDGRTLADALAARRMFQDVGATASIIADTWSPPAPPSSPTSSTSSRPCVAGALHAVRLETGGADKLSVVKIVKDLTAFGLKDAKDLVDQAPKIVKAGLDAASAEYVRRMLEDAGGTATIIPDTWTHPSTVLASCASPSTSGSVSPPAPPIARYSVRLDHAGADKVSVIKLVESHAGLGLKEAKDLVDQAPKIVKSGLDLGNASIVQKDFQNVGATASVVPETPSSAPPAIPSGSVLARAPAADRAVVLDSAGPRTIEVISVVRQVTGLSLADAKALVQAAPKTVKTGVTQDEAASIQAALAGAGASARVVAPVKEPVAPKRPSPPSLPGRP